jgi:hypothetical protein
MLGTLSLPDDNWIGSVSAGNGKLPYGWAGELTYPNTIGFDEHFQLYRDMVYWIAENVNNHRSNVLWTKIGDCIYVQFRKEKDMVWFSLRFGQ